MMAKSSLFRPMGIQMGQLRKQRTSTRDHKKTRIRACLPACRKCCAKSPVFAADAAHPFRPLHHFPHAVGRVHYEGNHDLPRVRLCEPRLKEQGTPDSSSLGKDEDKASLLDEHSARGEQNRPPIAVTGV